MKYQKLSDYIYYLQTQGRYSFLRSEALAALQTTPDAFKLAALRLIKKKRLVRPKQGFYVIVPIEYQNTGAQPATWFIDSLMKFHQQPYYVGLLSAAALHGAAHQQPQVFQVVTNKALRPIEVGRTHIQFLCKKNITSQQFQLIKTPTGYMNVSTPETTAMDLIYFVKSAGHLSHVATVLSELHEKLNFQKLSNILVTENSESSQIQRLGYLLELVEANKEIVLLLKERIAKHKPRFVSLRSDKSFDDTEKNKGWRLFINEKIEIDL